MLANLGSWLAIDLASPVSAVGAQVQNNYRGDYTVEMRLFDLNDVQIGGPFEATGITTFLADDTSSIPRRDDETLPDRVDAGLPLMLTQPARRQNVAVASDGQPSPNQTAAVVWWTCLS